MTKMWGVAAGAAVIAGAIAVAGCSSAQGPKAVAAQGSKNDAALYQSPEQATLSWFYAINHKDKTDAVAHFTSAAAGQMNWGNGDTSGWPTFSALHCKPASRGAMAASVYCTFKESQAPAVGNPDSFWTVYLQRRSDGRWLIDNYGQG